MGTVSSQMDWERLPVAPLYMLTSELTVHILKNPAKGADHSTLAGGGGGWVILQKHFLQALVGRKKLHAASFFVFPLPLFWTTTMLFCATKTSNFLVTHYFYGGIVLCAYPIFCFLYSCSLLFFTASHFHLAGRSLLGASISHLLTAALNFFLRNSSP